MYQSRVNSALLTSIYSVHYHNVQLIHVCSIHSSICTQLMSVVGVDANITSVKRVHWSSTKNQHGASSVASRLVAFLIQPKVHDFDSCLYMAGPPTTCHINVCQFWEPAVCDRKQDPSVLNSHVAECWSQKVPKHDFGHFWSSEQHADGTNRFVWYNFLFVFYSDHRSRRNRCQVICRQSQQTVIPKDWQEEEAREEEEESHRSRSRCR